MDSSDTIHIILLVVLLGIATFFSLAETALMALSKIRIKNMVEENIKDAKLVEELTKDPSKLMGAILIGKNISIIGSSAITTAFIAKLYGSYDIGILIATPIICFLVLIFGEIAPKSIAKQKSEQIALLVIKPIRVIAVLLKPLAKVLTAISSVFIQLVGCDPKASKPFITEEELKSMVGVSEEVGVLEDVEKQIIFNVFDFADLQVKDVMIQRVDIIALDIEAGYNEVINIIKEEQFSRIPIYNETIDNIVGILNVKDLILADDNKTEFKIKDYTREPFYTFEFKMITEVFKEMKKTKNHIAVVLDEYGGTVGIITIEDLIEEIVGDIEDEYDDEKDVVEVVKEDEYIVDGSAKLNEVSELLGVNMESEELDSVGGLVIGELGRIPEEKEEVKIGEIRFIVEEMDKNRIKKVRIYT